MGAPGSAPGSENGSSLIRPDLTNVSYRPYILVKGGLRLDLPVLSICNRGGRILHRPAAPPAFAAYSVDTFSAIPSLHTDTDIAGLVRWQAPYALRLPGQVYPAIAEEQKPMFRVRRAATTPGLAAMLGMIGVYALLEIPAAA